MIKLKGFFFSAGQNFFQNKILKTGIIYETFCTKQNLYTVDINVVSYMKQCQFTSAKNMTYGCIIFHLAQIGVCNISEVFIWPVNALSCCRIFHTWPSSLFNTVNKCPTFLIPTKDYISLKATLFSSASEGSLVKIREKDCCLHLEWTCYASTIIFQ